MKNERVVVVGAGGWGTALSIVLAESLPRVVLWSYERDQAREMQEQRVNEAYLPGVALPDAIEVVHDLGVVAEAGLVVLVTPSKALRQTALAMREAGLPGDAVVVTCTKGIEFSTGMRMSEIVQEVLPGRTVAALSGPSHAEEVARRIPTAVVAGSSDPKLAERVQTLFSTSAFRVYTTDDVPGMELGGALKNVFALAAGIGDGLGLGDNSKAALVTRSLAEMTRLGMAMGGRRETFHGLSGIGDLMVTCFSRHSRNRGFGERLGQGETVSDIEASTRTVAEGVPTARSAAACAARLGIECPVVSRVLAILDGNQRPLDAMHELMTRDLKPEI